MWKNVIQNSGVSTSIGGLLIVFGGLVLIACVIYVFNRIFRFLERKEIEIETSAMEPDGEKGELASAPQVEEDVPLEDQIAIAALIELYRRVHFDAIQSNVTFIHGNDAQNAWRLGFKYGQRRTI